MMHWVKAQIFLLLIAGIHAKNLKVKSDHQGSHSLSSSSGSFSSTVSVSSGSGSDPPLEEMNDRSDPIDIVIEDVSYDVSYLNMIS